MLEEGASFRSHSGALGRSWKNRRLRPPPAPGPKKIAIFARARLSYEDCASRSLARPVRNPHKFPSNCRSLIVGKSCCVSISENFFLLAFPNKRMLH
jgi:hypothetical protein